MVDYNVPAAAYWLLLYLHPKERRFNEIIKKFPKATVAKILPNLEEYKYVNRSVSKGKPIQVTYSITEKGKDFVEDKIQDVLIDIAKIIRTMKKINPQAISQLEEVTLKSDEDFAMPSEEIRLLLDKVLLSDNDSRKEIRKKPQMTH